MEHQYDALDDIQRKLSEGQADCGGGYLCAYPVFQGIYRMVTRMLERGGQCTASMGMADDAVHIILYPGALPPYQEAAVDALLDHAAALPGGIHQEHQVLFGKGERQANIRQERTRIMRDEELLSRHGDLGTFIIRVQHRQNSSWQGRITWMDKNKTVYFRSIWEMIKLVEGALDTVSQQEDG